MLFFTLDMAFMLLGIGYLHRDAMGMPNPPIIKAGGFFALLAAFLAWYNALAGIADDSNRQAVSAFYETLEHKLTSPKFLHHPSRTFPLVDQGHEREGQIGRRGQQDGLGTLFGRVGAALCGCSAGGIDIPTLMIHLAGPRL